MDLDMQGEGGLAEYLSINVKHLEDSLIELTQSV